MCNATLVPKISQFGDTGLKKNFFGNLTWNDPHDGRCALNFLSTFRVIVLEKLNQLYETFRHWSCSLHFLGIVCLFRYFIFRDC